MLVPGLPAGPGIQLEPERTSDASLSTRLSSADIRQENSAMRHSLEAAADRAARWDTGPGLPGSCYEQCC